MCARHIWHRTIVTLSTILLSLAYSYDDQTIYYEVMSFKRPILAIGLASRVRLIAIVGSNRAGFYLDDTYVYDVRQFPPGRMQQDDNMYRMFYLSGAVPLQTKWKSLYNQLESTNPSQNYTPKMFITRDHFKAYLVLYGPATDLNTLNPYAFDLDTGESYLGGTLTTPGMNQSIPISSSLKLTFYLYVPTLYHLYFSRYDLPSNFEFTKPTDVKLTSLLFFFCYNDPFHVYCFEGEQAGCPVSPSNQVTNQVWWTSALGFHDGEHLYLFNETGPQLWTTRMPEVSPAIDTHRFKFWVIKFEELFVYGAVPTKRPKPKPPKVVTTARTESTTKFHSLRPTISLIKISPIVWTIIGMVLLLFVTIVIVCAFITNSKNDSNNQNNPETAPTVTKVNPSAAPKLIESRGVVAPQQTKTVLKFAPITNPIGGNPKLSESQALASKQTPTVLKAAPITPNQSVQVGKVNMTAAVPVKKSSSRKVGKSSSKRSDSKLKRLTSSKRKAGSSSKVRSSSRHGNRSSSKNLSVSKRSSSKRTTSAKRRNSSKKAISTTASSRKVNRSKRNLTSSKTKSSSARRVAK